MGSALDIEATGEDEQSAIEAVEQVFSSDDGDKLG
jgi:phosphotransferase system HPr-like phosphotransfer protein